MPHIVLESPISLDDIFNEFRPFHASSQQVQISYLDVYRSAYGNKMMVEIFVNEDPFQQRVGLVLRLREEGDLVIGLHEIGFPRPTKGMHLAVHHFADWVKSIAPNTAVTNSTLNEKFLEESLDQTGEG